MNIRAPVPQARKAAIGEMPRVASIGSTSAAAVMTPRALEPVTTWMMAAMMMGIRMAGKEDCTMMSAIFSATPAFFTKVARAPPIPVTTIGIAAATIPSFTQSFNTFLLFHSLPVRSRERIHPVNRAASGLPMKAKKFATMTDATVLARIKNRGNRMGSRDFDRDGSSMCSVSSAAFKNSSFGSTGVFNVMQ